MFKKIVKSASGVATGTWLSLLLAPTALAQVPVRPGGTNVLPNGFRSVPEVINTIFKVVVSAAGAIFIVLFLVGGIQYLTAAGNEEATTKARRLLVDSIFGLLIVLAAWAIGTWILGSLGLGSDSSNPFN